MPPSIRALVSYKKKDGTLTVSEDRKYLFWTPLQPPGSSPTVTIPVLNITNLQQTPESSPKVALRVFVKEENYVFSFTSKDNARKQQESMTNNLRDIIAANKVGTAAQLTPAATTSDSIQDRGEGGQSAAMAIAKAVSSKAETEEGWYDDNKLKTDFQLQRSLLHSSKPLNERFTQALREKPDSVTVPQFTAQFWSTRLHLLRAHAIEKAQKEGEFNVLPEIKYKTVIGPDGEPTKMLNVTGQQINLIFKQHPVVRQAYNNTVPGLLDEKTFWQRFFQSRLLKKLKGDRIDRSDPQDATLDKYLDYNDNKGPASIQHVPHFIDLEGNESNISYRVQREGWEMRAERHDEPILHTLNNLSTKLLSHVAPEDGETHGPIGMDEETFEQLRLRDLATNAADNRIVLNVREQQQYVAGQDGDFSADAKLYAKQAPAEVLSNLRANLQPSYLGSDENGTLRLDRAIGFDSEDDEDDEDIDAPMSKTNGSTKNAFQTLSRTRISSYKSLNLAMSTILRSVAQRQSLTSTDTASLNGLSQATFDALTITHNTTTEFLHYFWTLFHSGDSSKASELAGLVSTLDRSLDRINAVADQAEKERQAKLDDLRKKVREYFERTGKKRKVDDSTVGGGRAVVETMIRPTVGALRVASDTYRKVLSEQTVAANAVTATG